MSTRKLPVEFGCGYFNLQALREQKYEIHEYSAENLENPVDAGLAPVQVR